MLTLLAYGFDSMHLHSIGARMQSDNNASAAVLEANGFVREDYFREDVFFNGKFSDTVVYSRPQQPLPG